MMNCINDYEHIEERNIHITEWIEDSGNGSAHFVSCFE